MRATHSIDHSVAIIGMAARFPGSQDLEGFWKTIAAGRIETGEVPAGRWDVERFYDANPKAWDKTYSRTLAHLDDIQSFAPEFYGITPKRARLMDPQQRLILDCARTAIEDAGYAVRDLPRQSTGVYIGVSVSEHKDLVTSRLHAAQWGAGAALDHVPHLQAHTMVGQMLNMNAANISYAFDLGGPAFAVDTACSSALVAMHEAVLHLRAGVADAALVGGVYLNLDPSNFVAFSRIGALSRNGCCRPFDRRADGFVMGEGAGVVVLKRLSDALRDGDRVWAVIRGIAVNNDARSQGPMTPSSASQAAAIGAAWQDAGRSARDASMVETHGTATAAGDASELAAISQTFGDRADSPCAIGGVKANIGHALAASGMASLIKIALALHHETLPPQAGFETPRPNADDAMGRFRLLHAAEPWRAGGSRLAGVSSFGFGGTNAHVVLEEAPRTRRSAAAAGEPARWPFRFSAPNADLLREYLGRIRESVSAGRYALGDLAWTACVTRRADRAEARFTAASTAELVEKLESAARGVSVADTDFPADLPAFFETRRGTCVALPPSPLAQRELTAIAASAKVGSDTKVESTILEAIAQVSSYSHEHLGRDRRLKSELGFDSLMTVDLTVKIAEAFPSLVDGGMSLFEGQDPSVGEFVDGVSAALRLSRAGAVAGEPRVEPQSRPVAAFRPTWIPRPVAAALPGSLPPAGSAFTILPDAGGVAEALAALLAASGLAVSIGALDPGAALIDLSALDASPDPREAPLRLLSAIHSLAPKTVPAALLLAHRGIAGAGLPAMAASLASEWPNSLVRSIEFDSAATADEIALRIFEELSTPDRAAEVAWRSGIRSVPAFEPAEPSSGEIRPHAVIAISGGTRGIGRKMAIELARQYGARLILLGRNGASALRDEVRAAGGEALVLPCDVCDRDSVLRAFDAGRAAFGPIEHVLHAAGIVEDASIDRKDAVSFARVLDTKIAGAMRLLEATRHDPLRSFVSLGSWAGRFGNAGQADYATANRALCALPGRTVELPLWLGAGMAAALPESALRAMADRGAPFLDDATGIPAVMRALAAGRADETWLLAPEAPEPRREAVHVFHVTPSTWPWLRDHTIDGVCVVPMAKVLDWCRAAVSGFGSNVVISRLERKKGIRVSERGTYVSVAVSESAAGASVEISWSESRHGRRVPGYVAYAQAAGPALSPLPETGPLAPGTLPLKEFYSSHAFHGPSLRVIEGVPSRNAHAVCGVVRAAGNDELDVPALDGALQVAAWWSASVHGRMALPLGVESFRLVESMAGKSRIQCVGILESEDAGGLTGHFDLFGADGALLAQIRGLKAEFRESTASAAVDDSKFRIEMFPEVAAFRQRKAEAEAAGLPIPYFMPHEGVARDTSIVAGRELLSFSTYNYLGMSGRPAVTEAAAEAARRYGTSVSASRVAAGERPIHRRLESAIARFLGCEDSIVFVGGHATNVSTIGHIVGPGDLILCDSLSHDSIIGGARLSGARLRAFPHNDVEALDRMLAEMRPGARRVLIAVEGVYSMDGDVCPLDRLVALRTKHRALLLVDEAHSLGVLGVTGRGVGEHFGVERCSVDLWMGTLSKSLGSCGGYIAGSAALVEYLKYTAPGFVFSAGISPANTAAALASVEEIDAHPELVATLRSRSNLFRALCRESSIDIGNSAESAVIPCIIGDSTQCLLVAEAMMGRGVNVHPIVYPAVEEHTARLRFFVSALHSEEQIRFTVQALHEELAARGRGLVGKAAA